MRKVNTIWHTIVVREKTVEEPQTRNRVVYTIERFLDDDNRIMGHIISATMFRKDGSSISCKLPDGSFVFTVCTPLLTFKKTKVQILYTKLINTREIVKPLDLLSISPDLRITSGSPLAAKLANTRGNVLSDIASANRLKNSSGFGRSKRF